MEKAILFAFVGAATALAALWIGSYTTYTFNDWRDFPAFLTALFFFIGGVIVLVIGVGLMFAEHDKSES